MCHPSHSSSPLFVFPAVHRPCNLLSQRFVAPTIRRPCVIPVVPAVCRPRRPCYSSSPWLVVATLCHPCSLSPPIVAPAVRCNHVHCSTLHRWLFVVLGSIIVSTSISPYEQWLADRVGVLRDMALAMVVTVQERACCHPASRGSQRQHRVLASAVVVIVRKQALCHPASRSSQRQRRASWGTCLAGLCVSFGRRVMSLSRYRNLKMKKNI